jgi:hypothetical protein
MRYRKVKRAESKITTDFTDFTDSYKKICEGGYALCSSARL